MERIITINNLRNFAYSNNAIPERGHCDLPPEVWEQYNTCILQGLGL